MKIQLKETKDLDYDKVVDIFYEVDFLKHNRNKEKYKKAIKEAFHNSQYVVSAWVGNKLVAFARVLTDKTLFATIWNMIVKKKYQKRGVGKKIIQKCLDKYPNCQFFLIADKKVEGFFKKLGFRLHTHGMYLEKGRQVCIIYN